MHLTDYRAAVAAAIKTFLPKLKACQPHGGRFDLGELKQLSARCPAVFVAILAIPGNVDNGDETRTLTLRVAAYVLTDDKRSSKRDEAAINIVESLTLWLPYHRWGLTGVGAAGSIASQNLYSGALDQEAVALWAVTWEQDLTVGDSVFNDPTAALPSDVYASWEPQTGEAHVEDYEEITEFLEEEA